MNGVFDGPIHEWFIPMIANQSGARHDRLRGLVNRAFTPRMINELLPFIRSKVAQLTDGLVSKAECEFLEDFGNPLPLAVMCELLGVPPADYDTFSVWTTDIGLDFSLAYGGGISGTGGNRRSWGCRDTSSGRCSALAGRLGPPVVAGKLTWRPAFGNHGPTTRPLRF